MTRAEAYYQMLAVLKRAIASRWLSIDFDHNRTTEAVEIRREICAAIDNADEALDR